MRDQSTVFKGSITSAEAVRVSEQHADAEAEVFTAKYVPPEHRALVGRATQLIQASMASVVDNLITIGKQLTLVKAVLKHGAFLMWIKELGFAERTAQRLMNIYRQLGTRAEIFRQVKPTALYDLSKPSTPEVAIHIVVERLVAGERLSVQEVSDIIAACKGNPARKDEATAAQVARALRKALNALNDQMITVYKEIVGVQAAMRLHKTRRELSWLLDQVQSPGPPPQSTGKNTIMPAPASKVTGKMLRKAKKVPQLSHGGTGHAHGNGSVSDDQVVLGCTVLIRNIDTDETASYTIVEEESSEPLEGRISVGSPVARALLGTKVGEIAMAQTPDGTIRYAIIGIRFADSRLAGTGFEADAELGQSGSPPNPADHADTTTDTSRKF